MVNPTFQNGGPDGVEHNYGLSDWTIFILSTAIFSDSLDQVIATILGEKIVAIALDVFPTEVSFTRIGINKRQAEIL
jgi:hypothetical protein